MDPIIEDWPDDQSWHLHEWAVIKVKFEAIWLWCCVTDWFHTGWYTSSMFTSDHSFLFDSLLGRLSTSSGSDNKPVPRSPLRRLTQFFKRQNSEPVKTSQSHPSLLSNQQINSSTQIFGRDLKDVCTPELPRPIMVSIVTLQITHKIIVHGMSMSNTNLDWFLICFWGKVIHSLISLIYARLPLAFVSFLVSF